MMFRVLFIISVVVEIMLPTNLNAQAFDPYAAAQATQNSTSSAYSTTTPSGLTGYTPTNTISATSPNLINSGLSSLQMSGTTAYSPTSPVGSVFATQGNNPIKIPQNAAFLGQSTSLATSGTAASNYLNSQGVVTLPATTNATQFTVFPGGGTPNTVCTQTANVTNSANCNISTTYNYNSCNFNQGTAVAVPCVPAPASATAPTVVDTTVSPAIMIVISMASQCPSNFSMSTYSGVFSMTASDNSTTPNTATFNISTAQQASSLPVFTISLATGTHSFAYTGGCSGPIGGVQNCIYQFTDTTTGVLLAPLTFSYTPDSGTFQPNLTDTCTPWETSASNPPAVCSPATPCCTLSTTACSNSTPIIVNNVSILPPSGCWTTQSTYSCNVGTDASACASLSSQGYTAASSTCVLTDQYGNCTTLQETMIQNTTACLSNTTTITGGGSGTTAVVVCDKYAPTVINTTCNITFGYTYPYCDIYYGTIVTTPCVAAPAWSTPWINDGAGAYLFSFPSQCPNYYFSGTASYNYGGSWPLSLPTYYVIPDTSPWEIFYSWWNSNPSFYYYVWVSGGCTGLPGQLQTCKYKFWTSNDSNKYSYTLAYTATVQYTPPGAYVQNTVTDNCTALSATPNCTLGSQSCINPWPQYVNGVTLYPPGGCWDMRKYFYCFQGKNTSACDTLTAAGYVTMSAGTCISTDIYGNCLALQYKMNKTVQACVLSHTVNMATLTIQGGCASSATGNCVSQPPPQTGNGSMAQTIAQLQAAFSLKSNFSGSPPMFFTGNAMQCGSSGFYNCCSNSPSIINPSCNTMEQQLAAYRSAGECTYVGGYCSYSIDPCQPLGSCTICLQNSDVYCCYSSQLGDIIQTGAHSQLGIPWVTGALPGGANCGPISTTQLMGLNFSLMDFSPLFGQINVNMASTTTQIQQMMFSLTNSTATTTTMCPTCP